MKRANILILVCMLLSACTTAGAPPATTPDAPAIATPTSPPASPQPTQTYLPTPTSEKARRSVMLISWDGGKADTVYGLIDKGVLPNFYALAQQGVRAEYAQSVDPSLTAAAQNSIATGAYPWRTGIVSNSYHQPSDSFYWYQRGFDDLLDQAEPVWVTASRAGLTSAAVFFNGGSPQHPGQLADYTIGYGIRDAYSRQEKIAFKPTSQPWQGEIPASFSPLQEASFNIKEVARVYLLALDSSDDGQVNYDTVLLNTTRSLGQTSQLLQANQWGRLLLVPSLGSGAEFLIQGFQQEPLKVTLFYTNVYHNTAAPRQLLEALNEKFGFFPSGPDSYALEHGWITPEQNLYLLEESTRWMAEVAAWVYTTYQPDLLYTWQDAFDAAGHSYSMQDPRQLNYSPEAVQQNTAHFEQAAQMADSALGIILDAVDLDTTTMLLVADHGMAPIHTVVYVNTILEQAGLLVLDEKDYVVVNQSKAIAVASGGAVHIYINIKGHEKDGIVPPEEIEPIQAQIIEIFSTLSDPQTGEPVFQRVLPQEQLDALHLYHINSGDIFAQANPGYHLDSWRGMEEIFEPADFYGQHGYDSTLPDMHAFFIAAGLGVPASGEWIPPVQIIDYAPTIAHLLGFTPATEVDGLPIPALLGSP